MSDHILVALRSGQAAEALSLAEAQLAEQPELAENHYWQALALQSLGRKDEALAAIDAAIARAPERSDFTMTRSVMLLGGRDLTQAQSGLMDALALNPNALEAYIGLIHIALGQSNVSEAKRLLRLAERVDDADPDVLLAKGAVLQAEGDLDAALALFTRVCEQRPDSVLALSCLGNAYLQKGMPAFAVQALSRASSLSPAQPGLLRALIQALLSENDLEALSQALDRLLVLLPDDCDALKLRLQLRQHHGDAHGVLADAEVLLAAAPGDVVALNHLSQAHLSLGDVDAARAVLDAAVSAAPDQDAFWQLRCALEDGISGDNKALIDRWLAARPQSGAALEALAVHAEIRGDLTAATTAAEAALAVSEAHPMAQFVKLRQEVRDNPEAALDRLALLAQRARSPEAQRMVLAWIGLASDRLGRYADAADAFTRMSQIVLPLKALPTPYPARDVPETGADGRLLWAPVGARIEPVLNALVPVLGARLLADRNQPSPARDDGFGAFRAEPGTEYAGSAFSWRTGVQALGLQPAEVVDWLPQWDGYTAAALAGTELTALIIDPRDALINWLVFGSAQSFVFHPKIKQSAKWLAAVFQAVADTIAQGPQAVHVIRIDAPETDAPAIAAQLQSALAMDAAPDATVLATPVLALGGMPNQFPAGHWRNYRSSFAEAFDLLTPAAVRLGYPQD
jgi:tetratricopeptide (TPR) repeat protein